MPSRIIETLLQTCQNEWQFFGRSSIALDGTSTVGLREYEDGAWQRIADYWRFIGGAYKNLTGRDRGTAWSAAFVSFCMHEAGAGDRFPYSAGHSRYINAAIRDSADPQATLFGQRLKAYRVKPGDLIGYWRGETRITFDNARSIGWYESHTDIVIEVGAGFAHAIGGNVMHSVTRRTVKLGTGGNLVDRSQNWFVVIQNNL